MKAKFIGENIEFKRGLARDEIIDRILDRVPRGSLFLTSGKFPYLFMFLGETLKSGDKERGQFIQVGSFHGGGGRKTAFRFIGNPQEYWWLFNGLTPLQEASHRRLYLINIAVWSDDEGNTSWDRVQELTGVKPLVPGINEASFERARSDRDIKSALFGYRVGQLVTPREMVSEITQPIGIVNEIFPKGGSTLAGFGYIFRTPDRPPYFDRMSGQSNTSANPKNYRLLNEDEIAIVKEFMDTPGNKQFIAAKERQLTSYANSDTKIKIFI